ncbi:nucleotidyltransferase domain-containing protein [Alkalilimnicola ehrlichii MLHE-1]|nr:nucleotidyltransferase domain-containing protein [Alkalilimnicola ehrlichii]
MRLTSQQIATIRKAVAEQLGEDARVRLFGSRVDDAARGGDIDLLVETDRILANRPAEASRLAAKLQLALGDQRIDVLIIDPATRMQPIHKVARETGVAL